MIEAAKVSMAQDIGGHFEIQNGGILSYKILSVIIQICCMGIISLLKTMMTLYPPTGNGNLVWLMH